MTDKKLVVFPKQVVFREDDRTIEVELFYPRTDNLYNAVQVGLTDVRAADDIRIQYDFDRDGWSITQCEFIKTEGCTEPTNDWAEVAFVKAWGRETIES